MAMGILSVLVLIYVLTGRSELWAEELHTRFFREVIVSSGFSFQRWSGDDDTTIREISFPLVFYFTSDQKAEFRLGCRVGICNLRRAGESFVIRTDRYQSAVPRTLLAMSWR